MKLVHFDEDLLVRLNRPGEKYFHTSSGNKHLFLIDDSGLVFHCSTDNKNECSENGVLFRDVVVRSDLKPLKVKEDLTELLVKHYDSDPVDNFGNAIPFPEK